MLILTIASGPEKGRVFRLDDGGAHLIGRCNGDVSLRDTRISRRHAEVFRGEDGWYIRDLGSRNGTLVNRERADEPLLLHDGDRIHLGRQTLVFNAVPGVAPDAAAADAGSPAAAHEAPDEEVLTLYYEERSPAEWAEGQQSQDTMMQAPGPDRGRAPNAEEQAMGTDRELTGRPLLQHVLEALRGLPTRDEMERWRCEARDAAQGAPGASDASAGIIERIDRLEEVMRESRAAPDAGTAGAAEMREALRAELDGALRRAIDEVRQAVGDRLEQLLEAKLTACLDSIGADAPSPPDERIGSQLDAILRTLGDQPLMRIEQKLEEVRTAASRPDDGQPTAAKLEQILEHVQAGGNGAVQTKLDEVIRAMEAMKKTEGGGADTAAALEPRLAELERRLSGEMGQKLAPLLERLDGGEEALRRNLDEAIAAARSADDERAGRVLDAAAERLREAAAEPVRPMLSELAESIRAEQRAHRAGLEQVLGELRELRDDDERDQRLQQIAARVGELADAQQAQQEALARLREAIQREHEPRVATLLEEIHTRLDRLSDAWDRREPAEDAEGGLAETGAAANDAAPRPALDHPRGGGDREAAVPSISPTKVEPPTTPFGDEPSHRPQPDEDGPASPTIHTSQRYRTMPSWQAAALAVIVAASVLAVGLLNFKFFSDEPAPPPAEPAAEVQAPAASHAPAEPADPPDPSGPGPTEAEQTGLSALTPGS